MKQKITEIQIIPIKPDNGLVGFASFVYDNNFYIGSIGIYTRPKGGYRLTYPTRMTNFGGLSILHPINKGIASTIEKEVITRFEEVTKQNGRHSQINS